MKIADEWKDYECIDASNGEKYERWGNVYLLRPDPQIIWDNGNLREKYRGKIDAIYHRSSKGGGAWENVHSVPSSWDIRYHDLIFHIKQMGFKHTGLFPEQAINWEFMMNKIRESGRDDIRVLNLFAYTGGATVSCLSVGAYVTHVDSSRGMVDWCRENVKSSGYQGDHVRYIVDDVIKFVKREIRRGKKYDAIVMDPPSYGRGSNGEVWNIEKNLNELIYLCMQVLSDHPIFFLINSYTTGMSSQVLENLLKVSMGSKYSGKISSGEVGLKIREGGLVLPCGIYGRWESHE